MKDIGLALQELISEVDCIKRGTTRADDSETQPDGPLIQTIRWLLEMRPEERTILIELLKALG